MQMDFICSSEKPQLNNTINCKLYDENSWYSSTVISHVPLKQKRCKLERITLRCEMKREIFQKLCFISNLGNLYPSYINPQEYDLLVCCPGCELISRNHSKCIAG